MRRVLSALLQQLVAASVNWLSVCDASDDYSMKRCPTCIAGLVLALHTVWPAVDSVGCAATRQPPPQPPPRRRQLPVATSCMPSWRPTSPSSSGAAAFSSGSSSWSRRRSCISKPAARTTPAARRASDSEEAGSGVIIERRGKLYVLTNRHVIKYSTLTGINIKLADGRVMHPEADLGRSAAPT